MPITDPARVTASHIRWPIRAFGHTVYRLITDAGDFVSARPPDIFDQTGAPTALAAELAPGSIVRVSTSDAGAMMAVLLVQPIFANPFSVPPPIRAPP